MLGRHHRVLLHYIGNGVEIQLHPYGYPTDLTPFTKDVCYCGVAGTVRAVPSPSY